MFLVSIGARLIDRHQRQIEWWLCRLLQLGAHTLGDLLDNIFLGSYHPTLSEFDH